MLPLLFRVRGIFSERYLLFSFMTASSGSRHGSLAHVILLYSDLPSALLSFPYDEASCRLIFISAVCLGWTSPI